SVARLGLGLGEAANFPAALKTVAEWFPQKERSLATGIFNSGSNIGAVLAPIAVPLITLHFGWQSAFLFTGALSMSWAILWFTIYREPERHPKVSPAELSLIQAGAEGPATARVSYTQLLRLRPTWAFLIGKFLTDPVWWFYLYWIPGFLQLKYNLDLIHIGPPLVTIYLLADIGSIGGGWISTGLMHHGWTASAARKTAMLVCALCVTAVIFVPKAAGNLWLTVALIAIAAAAHQGWSANLFTIPSDCFPRSTIASIVGLGGLGGAIGGMLAQPLIGRWLDFSHEKYAPLFWGAGSAYLIALGVIQLLLPRFERFRGQ
ncbi:MAG: MFS transporter, partial [Acidobacteriaceae bacterium]|nr:MFS transporter [Acidobacteriaceae bacterium]